MPTTVHIPKPILAEVDRRARRLKISRNGFIVQALERELARETRWTPGFLERLAKVDQDLPGAVDQMLSAIRQRRTRKGPPAL